MLKEIDGSFSNEINADGVNSFWKKEFTKKTFRVFGVLSKKKKLRNIFDIV
jgi:hypothetical protein